MPPVGEGEIPYPRGRRATRCGREGNAGNSSPPPPPRCVQCQRHERQEVLDEHPDFDQPSGIGRDTRSGARRAAAWAGGPAVGGTVAAVMYAHPQEHDERADATIVPRNAPVLPAADASTGPPGTERRQAHRSSVRTVCSGHEGDGPAPKSRISLAGSRSVESSHRMLRRSRPSAVDAVLDSYALRAAEHRSEPRRKIAAGATNSSSTGCETKKTTPTAMLALVGSFHRQRGDAVLHHVDQAEERRVAGTLQLMQWKSSFVGHLQLDRDRDLDDPVRSASRGGELDEELLLMTRGARRRR